MNARDKFIEVLRSRGMLRPGEEWVIDANLAAHAHELAEQIRQDTTVMGEAGDQYALLYADLIDPEVNR